MVDNWIQYNNYTYIYIHLSYFFPLQKDPYLWISWKLKKTSLQVVLF